MNSKSKSNLLWVVLGLIILAIIIVFVIPKKTEQKKEISIGSQSFSETVILADIAKILIEEETDINVKHIPNMEFGVMVSASEAGDLDSYLTYSGSQFSLVLQEEITEEWIDRDKMFEYVQRKLYDEHNMSLLSPLGFDNTFAIAIRRDFAQKYNIKKISDLKPYSKDMVIATDPDFFHREEIISYSSMLDEYGLEFKHAVSMEYGLMYNAVYKNNVDAAVAYSSDGRIVAMDLTILEDDKSFFPPYDAMFVIRNEVLEQYPELLDVLEKLSDKIDQDTVQRLNSRVDLDGDESETIARDFLKENNLI